MDDQTVDPAFIERLEKMGGIKLRNTLIQMYIDRVPAKLEEIRAGTDDSDFESVQMAAHSLVSSAGNLGGMAVSSLASQVEAAAIAEDVDRLRERAELLFVTCEEFETYLVALQGDV